MRLPLPFKRFFSISPSASSDLSFASGSYAHAASPLLPLVFPSAASSEDPSPSSHPLPTTQTPPHTFPSTFFTPTSQHLRSATLVASPTSPMLTHDHHHASRQPSPPDPDPSPEPPGPPPPISDAMWQSQFSLALSHLHTTLPLFFPPNPSPTFSPEIYHPSITLSLPIPLGGFEDIHGLTMYGLVFGGARRSLSLILGGMWVRVERCTILPPGSLGDADDAGEESPRKGGKVEGLGGEEPVEQEASDTVGGVNKARLDRKVRIRVKVGGRLRLPLTVEGGLLGGGEGLEREWTISNLYTFSPLTALITHHKVETVHPAPGEGVVAWLASWRSGGSGGMGGGGGKPRTAEEGCAHSSGVELERVRVRSSDDRPKRERRD